MKILFCSLFNYGKWKFRSRFFRSNYFLLICIFVLITCLFFNQQVHKKKTKFNKLDHENNIQLFIHRLRDITIFDQNVSFNITYSVNINGISQWLHRYNMKHFFNFYWLQNGAYQWHLQRLFDLKHSLVNTTRNFHQIFRENSNQTNIYDYLTHHPEHGIILDTSSDPIQPLFPPLPQASLSFAEICHYSPWLKTWQPCQRRTEVIYSLPLITYALYDVTIGICEQCEETKINDYDEMIFLFDSQQYRTNVTGFLRQILPRLIRLLALVPQSALIVLPHINNKGYVSQYLDVLIERGLINDRKRLIEYNVNEIYHANVIYSTSSPRSDLILLHRILSGIKPPVRRELILIIRHHLDDDNYNQIVQIINLFELPENSPALQIHQYNEQSFDLKQISSLFQQARLVIGMPTDVFSHIVWCQPRTDIIEIIQKSMTTNTYEISVQLQLNYWLVMTNNMSRIDTVDFRNLLMKVFMNIDV